MGTTEQLKNNKDITAHFLSQAGPQSSLHFLLIAPNSVPTSLPSPSLPVSHHHLLRRQFDEGPDSRSCDQSLSFSNHHLLAARMSFLKCKVGPIIPLIALLKLLHLSTPNARRVNQTPGGLGRVKRAQSRRPHPQCEVSFQVPLFKLILSILHSTL